MNKILRYSFVALLAMVFAPSFAEDKTDELTWEGLGLNGTNANYAAFADKSFNSTAVYAGTASSGTGQYIQLRSNKSDAGIVTTASGGKLKSVTITFNASTIDRAIDIYGKNEAYAEGPDMYNADKKGELIGTIAANGESMTITPTKDFEYVGMVAHNGAIYIDKITVVWAEAGGTPSVTVAAPTIDGLTPFAGSTQVTITNNEAGASVYYTTDGNDPTASSTPYVTPFTITETTTVKAIAIKGEVSSSVASKTFTAVPTVDNVAALNALENGKVFAFGGEALVVYVNGRYAYIKDETGSSLIFDNGMTKLANLAIGKKISANWTGKVSIYNNLFEAVPDATLDVVAGDPVEVSYPEAAISDVIAANMNQVVVIKDVTYAAPEEGSKNFNITKGDAVVNGYNQFGLEIAAPIEGKTYDITGVISVYKENVQFQPIAIAEAAGEDPGIDPSATIYEVPVSKFTPWDNCTIEGNKITMGEGWKGGAIYIGKDMTQFDYVWIKFKDATGTPNFGINYDEWQKNESWGPVFAATATAMDGTGMVGIKLDKKTVMVHGNAETDGVGIGDVYAQHVQQVTVQGGSGAASVEVEGIWFGTTAEFVKAGGDVPVRPEAGGSLTMWEGELVYNGWSVSSTVDPKYFEVAQVGDIIYCSVKDAGADMNPLFKYQDWSDFTDIQATLAKDETHFEGKIATADALDYLQKNGLRFQGQGFTLTKVELKVPAGSGINTINAAKVENAVRYNLAGQKVDNSFKGVVIVNGKKMLQK